MAREIVLDTETTGLRTAEGHRLISVTALELVDGKLTGRSFAAVVNPQRAIPPETTKIHGITDDMVSDKPGFAAIARDLKDFIGDSTIVITCRTDAADNYTLDIAFLDMELAAAGLAPFPAAQWLNVRRWAEAMFGPQAASLDLILDRYKIDRSVRDAGGHSATLDAQLLAEVYPKLAADYRKFIAKPPKTSPSP